MRRLDTGDLLTMEAAPTVTTEDEGATVLLNGLRRGVDYELAITFTNEAGTVWTRTLFVECVA